MLKITIATFICCFVLERVFTGWALPKVSAWYQRVIFANVVQLGVVLLAGRTWETWFQGSSILHLPNHLGQWTAGFAAYFIATFAFYWWHRVRHQNDFLWRYFHQFHHSPQRLEVITSFYKHPLEMIFNSLLGSLLIYGGLGLSIGAGAIYTLFTALGEFFYHTNMRTPRWMGYVFQRPEMHRIHHQFDYHRNNYGDFPIWDMIFRTYENPQAWEGRCGFDDQRELMIKDMLKFNDVHQVNLSSQKQLTQATESDDLSEPELAKKFETQVAEGDLIFLDIPHLLFRKVAESSKSWTSHVGIILKNKSGEWVASESKIPIARETPLSNYLVRAANSRFEIRRLRTKLNENQVEALRKTARSQIGKIYELGFNFDSSKTYCSKHVYQAYQSIGVNIGNLQTFQQLLNENPATSSVVFWKFWFFGFVPWTRRTITPASLLNDPQFETVLSS